MASNVPARLSDCQQCRRTAIPRRLLRCERPGDWNVTRVGRHCRGSARVSSHGGAERRVTDPRHVYAAGEPHVTPRDAAGGSPHRSVPPPPPGSSRSAGRPVDLGVGGAGSGLYLPPPSSAGASGRPARRRPHQRYIHSAGLPAHVTNPSLPPEHTLPVRAEYTAPAGAHRSATLRAVMVNRYHLPAHQHFTPSANRRPLDSEPIDRRRYSRGVSHASAGLAGTFVSTAPGQLLPLIIVLLVSVYLSVTIKTAISVSPLVQRAALRASAGMTGQGRGVCKVSFPRRRQLWSGGGQILARSDQCVY